MDVSRSDGAPAITEPFTERRVLLKILVGFVVAGILLYFLGAVVGWQRVFVRLAEADIGLVLLACGSTFVGLLAWGKTWQVVLDAIGIEVSTTQISVTYFAATFANYVTPFGQAGGEPFIAYVLSQDTGASYEDSLASVVSTDLLNLLPFFNFAAIGFAVLLLRAKLPDPIEPLVLGLTVLAIAIPVLAYAGWNHRQGVENTILRICSPLLNRTTRFSVDSLRHRIDGFYESLELIAADPKALLHALVFSYTGWVFFVGPLYLSAIALGLPFDPLLVLFIVPASTIAGLLPTPGGLGGVETALVALLIYLAGMTGGDALAVATVYRIASYWFAITVGGLASLLVIWRA